MGLEASIIATFRIFFLFSISNTMFLKILPFLHDLQLQYQQSKKLSQRVLQLFNLFFVGFATTGCHKPRKNIGNIVFENGK